MAIVLLSRTPPAVSLAHLANPQQVINGAAMGALVVHGFTATPHGMASLTRALASRGVSTHALCLPGHGGHPHDLAHVRWRDWLTATRQAYAELRAHYVRVALIGQSLGAALCRLLLAETPIPDVAVLMAMPWHLAAWPTRLSARMFNALPALTKRLAWLKDGGSDIADPTERYPQNMYLWTPLQAVCEVDKALRAQAKLRAPARCPTLIVHSQNDHTAPFTAARRLHRRLGAQASLLAVQRSWHVLTQDLEREAIAAAVADFVLNGNRHAIKMQHDWRWF